MRFRMWAATAAALLAPASASAQAPTVQPGDQVNGACTLSWLFDGSDGGVYFGTAAHCFTTGEAVTIADGARLGHMAMRGADGGDPADDVGLIRVSAGMEPRAAGALRGHPEVPAGVTRAEDATPGDLLLLSGWGAGADASQPTREQRRGVLVQADPFSWGGALPVINGDSGGPVAHVATNGAFGVNKGYGCTLGLGGVYCGTWGGTIAALERVAEKAGVRLTLRLAGQPAPAKPQAPQPQPQPSAPAQSSKPAPAKKPSAKAACRKKAKKIRNKRKRRAALKRCAKRR